MPNEAVNKRWDRGEHQSMPAEKHGGLASKHEASKDVNNAKLEAELDVPDP